MNVMNLFKKIIIFVIESTKNRFIALVVSVIVMLSFYWAYKPLWGYLFAILLAYLFADLIATLFMRGGNGIVQFTLANSTSTRHMGHGYLVFFISVIIGTILSGFLAEKITIWIQTMSGIYAILFPNIILLLLVFLDFHITFYSRK